MSHEEETTTTTTTSSSSSDDRPPILAVDMDETIIQSDTEELIPGVEAALKKLHDDGWKIIIWTCRGDAEEFVPRVLGRYGIPYDAINSNLPGIKDKSRKIIFDAIVDNKNVDFGDGWEAVVEELEIRRKGWQSQGITKATIYSIDPRTGSEEIVQEWSLDSAGHAVLSEGDLESLELELDTCPEDGEEFLKAISRSVNNTYLFSSVARGEAFLFAPKKPAKTAFGDNLYSEIFEAISPTAKDPNVL